MSKKAIAICLSLVLLAFGCKQRPRTRLETPIPTITVCSGCGSEWESYGPGEHKPITKCPNCPMTPEEFEALKEQLRKQREATQDAKEID